MKIGLLRAATALGGVMLLFGVLAPLGYGVWNTGVAGLLLAGALLVFLGHWWEKLPHRLRPVRNTLGVLAVLGLLSGMLCSIPMVRWGLMNPPPEPGDYTVVVLGCKVEGDQPSLMLRRRLQTALYYLREHPEAPVIVSGGLGTEKSDSEAEVMRRYLQAQGIEAKRIYSEDASRNTEQNLRYSAAIIREHGLPEQLVVATDGFHAFRARLYAARNGLTAYSCPSATPLGLLPAYWVRECFAIARAVLLP